MKEITRVRITCPECGHKWRELLKTDAIDKEEVYCPKCDAGHTLRDCTWEVLKEIKA
jgi:ribosomal protein S27AE